MTQMGTHRSEGSVSAVMAAVNGLTAERAPVAPRFPTDAHSLADLAQRDLDAALQLLTERAQYITGATGAAIALRRAGHNDMLCRASTGPNAPELGALLSAEFGLSGESVRTRLPLRCDDAERDGRVNREGCRQLGVASVAVMPIVTDDEVLGVFELFSGKANAFGERDLSVLQRLGELVETAVRLAQTALNLPAEMMGEFVTEVSNVPVDEVETKAAVSPARVEQAAAADAAAAPALPKPAEVEPPAAIPVKKTLLWSAASLPVTKPQESDQSHVPPVLRHLHKCKACGFPVSAGRTLCLDCEEKQWRGPQRVPAAVQQERPTKTGLAAASGAPIALAEASVAKPVPHSVQSKEPMPFANGEEMHRSVASLRMTNEGEGNRTAADAMPILSAGISSSESWLAANKYILGAVVMVVVALAVIALLR